MAGHLGDLLEVGLQQWLRQIYENGRREEEHDLPHDVRAAERFHRLNRSEAFEHWQEGGHVVDQVLDARFLLGHDAAVEAGELDEAIEGVVAKLGIVTHFQMELKQTKRDHFKGGNNNNNNCGFKWKRKLDIKTQYRMNFMSSTHKRFSKFRTSESN